MYWIYKDDFITSHKDLHPDCTHIVYCLTFEDGMKYIGYKTVRSERRLKPTKEQLSIRKNYKRVEIKDLPFIKYVGSSSENKDKVLKSKEILYQTSNKRTATYIEAKLLFKYGAIESDKIFTNKNIAGRYFDNCMDGLL